MSCNILDRVDPFLDIHDTRYAKGNVRKAERWGVGSRIYGLGAALTKVCLLHYR